MSKAKRALELSLRPLRFLAVFLSVLGGIAMLAMLGLIVVNIVLRQFDQSVRGTVEMSGYLCAMAVGLCMPAAQLAKSHIGGGVWNSALPAWLRFAFDALCNLACAVLLALAGWELLAIANDSVEMGEMIDGFDFSIFTMAAGFAVGILLHALLFLHGAASAILTGKEAPV